MNKQIKDFWLMKLPCDSDQGMPAGTIQPWQGEVGNIPAGWAICDGTQETPDLTDRPGPFEHQRRLEFPG